jgi:hypothetical protein
MLAASGTILLATCAVARQETTSRAGTRPASEVLARIGQGAGVAVVADSTITERVALPSAPATAATAEQQIAEVVKALPAGTKWAKLYLPAAKGRAWNGDDVAAYALAQAKLFGTVGAAPAGSVEIMGQILPAAKAQEQIAALNLKPVYLVTNPTKRTAAAASGGADPGQWAQMTEEQRQQYAQQQAAQLLNADPAVRNGVLQQQFMVFSQMMRQMTPEQRQQVFQGMGISGNVQFQLREAPAAPPQ